MFEQSRRKMLTLASAFVLACTGTPNATAPASHSIEDVIEQASDTAEDSTTTRLPTDYSPWLPPPAVPHELPRSLPFPLEDASSTDTPDTTDSMDSQDSSNETNDTEEKWVKVGDDHHQKWCPPETPIYVAGKCTTIDQVKCDDSDGTEVLFKQSSFGDFLEETIVSSDKSLGIGGTVSFSLTSKPTFTELLPDVCKGTFILVESYCSEGIPKSKGIKCNDYLPGSSCVVNVKGEAFCQPEDVCPTLEGIQASFLFDTNDDGTVDSCEPKDVCLDLPGIQITFPYDNDGNGIGDGCAATDICPSVEGLQTDFLYDTNNDQINDSCLPDYCPEVAGVQEEFPFDNDLDGIFESCLFDYCPTIAGTQDTYLFDNDQDGTPESCLEDLCKGIIGIQETFLYDNDQDGVPESCEEDLCLTFPGIQVTYTYDNDGDGVNDSCEPLDICLNIEGLQTMFLYDTDGDGINDSCTPDFCPEVTGVQEDFLFDNNQDGILESCLQDLCPEKVFPGNQTEYLYDIDGDGVKDSCVPVAKDFCTQPNPQEQYPEGTLYSYDSSWHMGFCLPGDTDAILHVICGQDGMWYTDITECELGMPCVNGACAECHDTDGTSFEKDGYVLGLDNTGSVYVKDDYCLETKTVDYRSDFTCVENIWELSYEACPDGHKCIEEIIDGTATLSCVPGAVPTCTDSDGTDNFIVKGYVEGTTKDEDKFVHNDFCLETLSGDAQVDYTCKNGYPEASYQWCEPDEICQETMEIDGETITSTLNCIPTPYEVTCTDSDGKENYTTKGYVYGTDKHGEPYNSNDFCIGNGSFHGIMDYWCEENKPKATFYNCPDKTYCKKTQDADGTNVSFACVKACLDTDAENNPMVAGTVFDFNNVPYPDVCEGDVLYQYQCNPDTGEKIEAGLTNCANGCDQGKCK